MSIGTLHQTGGGRFDWVSAGCEDPITGAKCCEHEHPEIIEGIEIVSESQPPTEREIEAVIEDGKLVKWDFTDAPAARKGYVKDIALVLIRKPGEMTDALRDRVKREAFRVEHWIRQTNDEGAFEGIRVTPYAIETEHTAQLLMPWHLVRDLMEEQHPGRYEQHTYFHAWGGYKAGVLGEAYVNSRLGITYVNGGIETIWHELCGHQFGCHHSRSGPDNYGHRYCVMGRGSSGLCASQLINLGVIPESEIVPLENDSCGFLCPAEVSKVDLREGETRVARLAGTSIILSTRKPYDQSYLGQDEEGNLFVEKNAGTAYNAPDLMATIKPGYSKEIAGVTIHNDGHQEGVVRVRVGDPATVPEYPLPQPPVPGNPIRRQHSGVWEDKRYIHQGLNIVTIPEQDNRVIAYWFTYRASRRIGQNSRRLFFTMDAEYNPDTGVYEAEIVDTSSQEAKPVGWAVLSLRGGRLSFRYYCKYFGRGSQSLIQSTTPREDPQGVYETGTFSGHVVGKFLGENPDGSEYDVFSAYWFGRGLRPNDLEWTAYQGTDRHALKGYRPDNLFESELEKDMEILDPVDLDGIIDPDTRIDPASE